MTEQKKYSFWLSGSLRLTDAGVVLRKTFFRETFAYSDIRSVEFVPPGRLIPGFIRISKKETEQRHSIFNALADRNCIIISAIYRNRAFVACDDLSDRLTQFEKAEIPVVEPQDTTSPKNIVEDDRRLAHKATQNDQMIACPTCDARISSLALACPRCESPFTKKSEDKVSFD